MAEDRRGGLVTDEEIIKSMNVGRQYVLKQIEKEVDLLVKTWKDIPPQKLREMLSSIAFRLKSATLEERLTFAAKLSTSGLISRNQFLELVANKEKKSKEIEKKIAAEKKQQERGKAPLETKKRKPAQADVLYEIMKKKILEFWRNKFDGYVTLPTGENVCVRDRLFATWLTSEFVKVADAAPSTEALNQAISYAESICQTGKSYKTFVRVAPCFSDDESELLGVYIDLCNEKNEIIEISPLTVKIVKDPPVRFIRKPGMLPLPHPVESDGNALSWFYENFRLSEEDYILILGFLLSCLYPLGPFPVLEITGEQGSGKSLLSRLIKLLIDPGVAALKSPPQSERDLMIWAKNSWLICINNVSKLSGWLSDSLCRISWDGGFSTRKLYTDDTEVLFDQRRPVVLNGIGTTGAIASRADLADRMIGVFLEMIKEEDRRLESEILEDFNGVYPHMLSQLYSAVSMALRSVNYTKLEKYPRLADVARWVTAGEAALGFENGKFVDVLSNMSRETRQVLFDLDPLAKFVADFVSRFDSGYEGSASEIYNAMKHLITDKKEADWWPKSPDVFGRKLVRLAPILRSKGIDLKYIRTANKRVYRFVIAK